MSTGDKLGEKERENMLPKREIYIEFWTTKRDFTKYCVITLRKIYTKFDENVYEISTIQVYITSSC